MLGKFFGNKTDRYEEYASNLYEALVLDPPSSDSTEAIGPSSLELDMGQFPRYSEKRLLLLEAMFCTAALTVYEGETTKAFVAIRNKISTEWKKRGLISASETEVTAICFNEVENLLENFLSWSKNWLNEFYDDVELDCPCLASWGGQCQNEYKAMVAVLIDNKDF